MLNKMEKNLHFFTEYILKIQGEGGKKGEKEREREKKREREGGRKK